MLGPQPTLCLRPEPPSRGLLGTARDFSRAPVKDRSPRQGCPAGRQAKWDPGRRGQAARVLGEQTGWSSVDDRIDVVWSAFPPLAVVSKIVVVSPPVAHSSLMATTILEQHNPTKPGPPTTMVRTTQVVSIGRVVSSHVVADVMTFPRPRRSRHRQPLSATR